MQISTHHPLSSVDTCPVMSRVEQRPIGTGQRKNQDGGPEMETQNKMAGVHAT